MPRNGPRARSQPARRSCASWLALSTSAATAIMPSRCAQLDEMIHDGRVLGAVVEPHRSTCGRCRVDRAAPAAGSTTVDAPPPKPSSATCTPSVRTWRSIVHASVMSSASDPSMTAMHSWVPGPRRLRRAAATVAKVRLRQLPGAHRHRDLDPPRREPFAPRRACRQASWTVQVPISTTSPVSSSAGRNPSAALRLVADPPSGAGRARRPSAPSRWSRTGS